MTRETPTMDSCKATDYTNSHGVPVLGGRRVEDQLRLRELELQTNFQIQTLTESLNLLKTDFTSWRDSLNEQMTNVKSEVNGLKTRLSVVIALLMFQLMEVPAIFTKLMTGGLL